jgi:FeS assembly SUF system protein
MFDGMYQPFESFGAVRPDPSTEYVLEAEVPDPPEGPVDPADLEEAARQALKTVYDPEIPVNIYDLGLIYDVSASETGRVSVKMTLTAPACPVAGWLVQQVQSKLLGLEGARGARTELVWEPPWTPDKMTEAARLQLGLF